MTFDLQSAFSIALRTLERVRDLLRQNHDESRPASDWSCDVRLCQHTDGRIALYWGDVGWDSEHAPHCAEGGLSWDATNDQLRRLARSLATELRDAVEADADEGEV